MQESGVHWITCFVRIQNEILSEHKPAFKKWPHTHNITDEYIEGIQIETHNKNNTFNMHSWVRKLNGPNGPNQDGTNTSMP